MVAREVEQAAAELRTLRREIWQALALTAVAFGSALAASQVRPAFAVPLFCGGVYAIYLLVRAMLRRFGLVDRLVLDRDAYAIAEVRKRGEQAATMKRRQSLASSITCMLSQPGLAPAGRVRAAATDLEELAEELADDGLALDPASAVACERLLNDVLESPLRNPTYPAEDVRSRIRQILAGFQVRGT